MKAKSDPAALALLTNDDGRAAYAKLVQGVAKFCEFDQEVKKTCVHFANGSAFLGVHPRAQGLKLTIRTEKALKGPRFRKVEQASAHRFYNDLLVANADEVDDELLGWIQSAAMVGRHTRQK